MAYEVSRDDRAIWWPVTINIPMDGGSIQKAKMEMRFKLPTKSEAKASATMNDDAFKDYMVERIPDWRGPDGGAGQFPFTINGEPLPYSRENLLMMLEHDWFENSTIRAMVQANSGVAVAKNS